MRSPLTCAIVSLALVTSVLAYPSNGPDLAQRAHHRALNERQRPNMNDTWSAPPSSSSSTMSITASSSESSRSTSASSTAVSSTSSISESSAVQTTSSAAESSQSQPSSASSISTESSISSTSSASTAAPSSDVITNSGIPTISVPSSASSTGPSTITSVSRVTASVTTAIRTASSSASAAAADSQQGTSSGGLSKTALIAIIVVSVVVGLAAIGFTLFRKFKLKPSSRFEKRLNAIDFSPNGGTRDDDFFEKAHSRHGSSDSAERHRKALVAEEFDGPNLVSGVPEHDFTAGAAYGAAGVGVVAGAGAGAYGAGMYNSDPFAHAQAYDYEQTYNHGYPPQSYDQYGNPAYPTAGGAAGYEYPTQDNQDTSPGGNQYADLQRGNSTGSGGHGAHGHVHAPTPTTAATSAYTDFPESGNYLGRPTGGSDGPYAQAAQYRTY